MSEEDALRLTQFPFSSAVDLYSNRVSIDQMTESGMPFCPGCGNPYDAKYPKSMFDLGMVDPDDDICREAGYVHVHTVD